MSGARAPGSSDPRQTLGLIGLAAVGAVAWIVLVAGEATMGERGGGALGQIMHAMMRPAEPLPYLAAAAAMWVVMMVAMMTPSALLMAAIFRRTDRGADAHLFALGYLAIWSAFALAGAALQWWLHARGWLQGMSLAASAGVSGGILLAAGLYQLTPAKDACLARCRSPLGFLLEHWRDGPLGAFLMGWRHGLFCIGCCWLLMLLMFAGGTMSVLTMAVLCALILAERVLPPGPWVSRIPGLALAVWGLFLIGPALARG